MHHLLILFFLFWIFISLALFLSLWYKYFCIKKRLISNKITQLLINQPLFSSLVVNDLYQYLMSCPKKSRQQLLTFLFANKPIPFVQKIKKTSLKTKLNFILKNSLPKHIPADPSAQIMQAQLLINNNLATQASKIIDSIDESPKNKLLFAAKLFIDAQLSFHNRDLLNASNWSIQAATIFRLKKLFYEEAQCYLLLGNIYRFAEQFDAAYFILRKAAKIFTSIHAFRKTAESFFALVFLTAAQERWEEASYFLTQAQDYASKINDETFTQFINCNSALLELAQNNLTKAHSIISTINVTQCPPNILALHNNVHSQICLAQEQWGKAEKFANISLNIYKKQKHDLAIEEIKKTIRYAQEKINPYKRS